MKYQQFKQILEIYFNNNQTGSAIKCEFKQQRMFLTCGPQPHLADSINVVVKNKLDIILKNV